jgi:molecular chaperone HtpG
MSPLQSTAENLADETRSLPGFREFSLPGVRDQVATLLGMIGRGEEIFSTYSLHDISHIEAMLQMLDWLVPPATKAVMTRVDWLLVTLAIYFHDLGLLVTSDEFRNRHSDLGFTRFLESLKTDPDSRDYIARAERMQDDEKERFFFQEWVRENHASRIREWITGRHVREWSAPVKAIAAEIAKLVQPLPPRFVENLGVVCESHHRQNLDRQELFPLCQHYGGDIHQTANVQYAAFLLRTADLMHVTKDRTPSVMYRTMKLSDPKGIDEWSKQLGTFSVHMKHREFDPADVSSHIIVFSADFSEERPYFALAEYLAYANEQIKETKRLADASQGSPDARDFAFPWHSVKSDVRVEGNEPLQISFELDRGRLLNLLVGHTIDNDPTVALRELLQNSIDATRFQDYLESELPTRHATYPPIEVFWERHTRKLVVRDRGTGMDLNIIKNHLMKVGSSFYDTPQFQSSYSDFTPISRFGIGVLACFMISDDVEIITCRDGQGHRIRMTAVQAEYLLKELAPESAELDEIRPHGTQVSLVIRDSVDLQEQTVKDILSHWVLLPGCAISYIDAESGTEQIGFESPAALLTKCLGLERQKEKEQDRHYVVTMRRCLDGDQEYEFAFVVRGGYTPERDFAQGPISRKFVSGVSVEGIRTDDIIPGLAKPSLLGVLSVKGNRNFRTTVSRSTLEQDEEYNKVARLCLNMLLDHVHQEVERIAASPGRPLSQASTAARWIFQTLKLAVRSEFHDELLAMYQEVPTVVVENAASESGSSRELLPLAAVATLPEFWTVESRLVDYLGIISRDLGRELSLHAFLLTLAPELQDSRLTPIVHDAHQHPPELLDSRRISSVEFSRKHQQTAIRWVPVDETNALNIVSFALPEELMAALHAVRNLERSYGRRWKGIPFTAILRLARRRVEPIYIAPVRGDLEHVTHLRARVAIVVDPSTEVADAFRRLQAGIALCSVDEDRDRLRTVGVILQSILISPEQQESIRRREGGDDFSRDWQDIVEEANEVLKRLGVSELPTSPASLQGRQRSWFDASIYWRDWGKKRDSN